MTKEITAALRSLDLSYGGSHSRLSAIASCFLEPAFGWTRGACEELRNMLIKLLEGEDGNDANDHSDGCDYSHHRCDQHQVSCYDELGATLSDLYGIWQDGAESENKSSESAHKMTKSAEIGELDVDSTSYQSHESSPMRQENETRITDELRKFKGHINARLAPETVLALRAEINAIADRIDAQFDRICEQQEAVLQQTIDEMVTELDSAKAKNCRLSKKWREKCEALKAENDELQEKNRHLAQKCDTMLVFLSNRAMNTTSDQERRIEKLVRQRDELREKLKEIGGIVNG